MREKEIKILWGRSGNRCAICKLELTPDGSRETLGEMAHIVAKSNDGPRGDGTMSVEQRDSYDNLILLCPTHHAEIDKNPDDWSISRLHTIKSVHEEWVSEQLNAGSISVATINNANFLETRTASWQESGGGHISIAVALTPLRVSGETLNTLDDLVKSVLERALLVSGGHSEPVNRYKTRPTEYGIANESFPELPKRCGYSFHIFRSGHCEYFYELGQDSDRITSYAQERGDDLQGAARVLRYTDVAEILDHGLRWLELVWNELLPFTYLTFSCGLMNSRSSTLYSYEDHWRKGVYGYPVNSDNLIYSDVLTKGFDREFLLHEMLNWLVNCYGLVLNHVYDNQGKYLRPVRMS